MADPISRQLNNIRRMIGLNAPPPPGRIQAMLRARRKMLDVPYTQKFEGTEINGGWVPDPSSRRVLGVPVLREGAGWSYEDAISLADEAARYLEQRPQVGGFFSYPNNMVVYPIRGGEQARGIRRHEVMHGLNRAASKDGSGLPMASRMTGGLLSYGKDSVFGQAGRVIDELVAQRVGGSKFGDTDWGHYANTYTTAGQPAAAALARAMQRAQVAGEYLPGVAQGVLAGGGLGAAYVLTRPSEEEQNDLGDPWEEDDELVPAPDVDPRPRRPAQRGR